MDMLPEARVLAAAYTPKAAGARNADAQKRADELTGGGKRVSIYDIQPQMWTYERTVEGGRDAVPRLRLDPRPSLRELQPAELPRDPAARHRLGRQARRTSTSCSSQDELGDALRYVEGGPTAPAKAAAKIEVHPEFDLTLVAAEPLIHKAMNIDWDEQGRLWVSETPEYPNGRRVPNTAPWKDSGSLQPARQDARSGGHHLDPVRHERRRRDGSQARLRRQARARHRFRASTGTASSRRPSPDIWYLEDTNGDEVADKRTKLYTGLGTADTHAVINNLRWGLDGWIYATHGYSVGTVTSPGRHEELRPRRQRRRALQARRQRVRAVQQPRRQHLGPRHHLGRPGVLDAADERHGVLPHRAARRACSRRARLPATTSWKGMITGQNTYPAMTWPEQAYVQIDQVGQFTAAAGLRDLRRRRLAGQVALHLLHRRADAEHRAPAVREAGRRELHDARRKPGREQTEFMRSTRSLVPADRDPRRARRRALRRRFLQPGRDPQRHARAAARPGQRRGAAGSRPLLRPHLARAAQAGDASSRCRR